MADLSSASPTVRNRFPVRLAIGLVQGLVLYGLYHAHENGIWPAQTGFIFTPVLAITLFVPLIAIQSYGNLRPRSFVMWVGAATLIIGALALYHIWRAWPEIWVNVHVDPDGGNWKIDSEKSGWQPQVLPSISFLIYLSAAIFVAHALVRSSDADGRFFAHYPTHFDIAWVQAIQLALSLAFVGVFWLLLFLGSSLFKLLGLTFLETLIGKQWFWIPATALAAAAAVHLTDASAGLVRGARTLVLTLFSWLLPVLVLLLAGFLGALAFTGLEPLWATRNATVLLILSATASLVLVNAVYQDGSGERPLALRLAGTLAAILMLPLVILAGYATGLRVGQYGWTADRVIAAAIIFIVAFHAIGYVIAVLRPGLWMKTIERWNFGAALVMLAVYVALFSPIADPQRIAVNSQMARLASGAVEPADFDFVALRWDGGRFGKKALETLAEDGDTEETRADAEKALAMKRRYEAWQRRTATEGLGEISVLPAGAALPDSFLDQKREAARDRTVTQCNLMTKDCMAILADATGDGVDEIILWPSSYDSPAVYAQDEDGTWTLIGNWRIPPAYTCSKFSDELREGRFSFAPPMPKTGQDLVVGGVQYEFMPTAKSPPCPE